MDDRLPHLLGPETSGPPLPNALSGVGLQHADLAPWFNTFELDGRELCSFVFPKNQDLGIQMEGGLGTPLGGKIVVAAVFDGGAAVEHGLQTGDQLMMVNGQKMVDITDMIHLVYAQSSFLNDEECV
ncbi:hypothetical protein BaRGS_00032974 [Batillaria attramentaria]|uniref:PDZ domain-containing protein n=1 Tax=Batillaria attramentaria TaxID=370345 RepID=A0ABD0JM86_9CAEN